MSILPFPHLLLQTKKDRFKYETYLLISKFKYSKKLFFKTKTVNMVLSEKLAEMLKEKK